MSAFLQRVALDRVQGRRPSTLRAVTAATVAGVAAAGVTYKMLRS
jgi:hypothetical protein